MATSGLTAAFLFTNTDITYKQNMRLFLEWKLTAQDGDNGGQTHVHWRLYYSDTTTNNNTFVTAELTYNITIDGEHVTEGTYSGLKTNAKNLTIAEGDYSINHKYIAGAKTFNFGFTASTDLGGDVEALGNDVLPKLTAIASQIIVPTVNIGETPTITINRSNSAYVDTLTYTFGSHGGTLATKTSATEINNFTYPQSFYAEIPNAKYGIGVITCETYNSTGGLVGTAHTEFRANVNEAASTPTIFPTIRDSNAATVALTGDSNTFVRYASIAHIKIGAEARNYATLKSQICANGSKAMTSAEGYIDGVEQAKFSLSATDSRGYTTAVSMTKPFIEYIVPTCNLADHLPDTAGNMLVECSGSYFAGDFGAQSNTLAVQYRYKAKNGSFGEWAEMAATIDGNSYRATADVTGLDYKTTYIVQARAIDKLNTATTGEADVVSLPVFHWSASDFVFEVPVTFKKGAEGVESGDTHGEWTPELDTTNAVKYYETQRGWYSRAGNVITIGFNIKAACNSGHNTEAIKITGLPFTPSVAAFGGGVMFGTYVNAGFCFEAWAAGTDGNITPRLQPCNNTSAGNLQIASTAYYPSGENTITLGGTITYLTND